MRTLTTRGNLLLFALLLLSSALVAQSRPTLTLSATRVRHHEFVMVRGTGFTPASNVSSHLRRPDGTEFPVLPILTTEQGEFSHEIDTLLLNAGVYELWVVDDATRISSDAVKFEVTLEQGR